MSAGTLTSPAIVARPAASAYGELSASDYAAFRDLVARWEPAPSPGLDDVLGVVSKVKALRDPAADVGQLYVDQATYGAEPSPWGPPGPAGSPYVGGGFGAREGRSFFLAVAPGLVQLRTEDETRRVRAEDRLRVATVNTAAMVATTADPATGELPAAPGPWGGGEIVEWSTKSRARMYWRALSLDWASFFAVDGCSALVTVTLPDDWGAVAPTGAAFKKILSRFRSRWTRAGLSLAALWKLEFQDRGAPHWHGLMRVPVFVTTDGDYGHKLGYEVLVPFESWLSRTWAECVGADDTVCRACEWEPVCECEVPDTEFRRNLAAGTRVDYSGKDYTDPRRIAVYFLGHSSKHTDGKEYQHIVPNLWRGRGRGPGRFWGVWGIDVALVELQVTEREHYHLCRILRKVKRARDGKLARLRAARGLPPRGRGRWQASYSLGGRGGIVGGWVGVNDGLLLALQLGRALALLRT